MKAIAITGTKGKTTLAFLLDSALRAKNFKTLLICSEGIFESGNKTKNSEYFFEKHHTSPTVAAFESLQKKDLQKYDFIILEFSYASANGIKKSIFHNRFDISVLTNVYWDHVDGKRIRNRRDLFEKKLDIIKSTRRNGSVFIYTGDKKANIAPRAISRLQKERSDIKIFSYDRRCALDKIAHKHICLLKDNWICLDKAKLLDYSKVESALKRLFPATDMSIIALAGILKNLKINPKIIYSLEDIDHLVPGRFNLFIVDKYKVVLDYAHEEKSLFLAARAARKLFKGQKIKAIIRLSYYRNDTYIKALTEKIAPLFDSYIVYDKAFSRPSFRKIFTNRFYKRRAGDVAVLMSQALKKKRKKTAIILNELEAIKRGIKNMKKNEALYVMGDQIERDALTIKKSLARKMLGN